MFNRRLGIAGVGVGLLVLVTLSVGTKAQAASPFGNRDATQGEAYLPPAVFVDQVMFGGISADGVITGAFVALSQNQDAVGDLHYRIEVLSPLPPEAATTVVEDAPDVYDIYVAPEIFAMAPGSEKSVRFEYKAPPLPPGDYRLRIQLVTSQGRKLGWQDVAVTLPGSDIQFLALLPGTISLPDFPDEIIPPTSGPNVAPGGQLALRATVRNPHAEPFTVIPTLTTYEFAIEKGGGIPQQFEPVTLAAGEERAISLPLLAATLPAVYESQLVLAKEGIRVSPLVEYRWVVKGKDAHIVSARIAEMAREAGQFMKVQVEYAGPGDAETRLSGILEITVRDEQGDVGTTTVPNVSLSDRIESGLARVELTRSLAGSPGLRVLLKDESGNVLDTYDVAIPLTEEELATLPAAVTQAPSPYRWVAIAVLVGVGLLGILLIIWYIVSRRSMPPASPTPTAPTLLLLGMILSAVGLGGAGTAWALGSGNGINVFVPPTGCQFDDSWCDLPGYTIEIFVNQPQHNRAAPYDRTQVPVSFRATWGVCENRTGYSQNILANLPRGGKYSAWENQPGNPWQELAHTVFGASRCGDDLCKASRDFAGTLNMSNVIPEAHDTTLNITSSWNWSYFPERIVPANYTPAFRNIINRYGAIHAVNVWLNLIPITTPTPVPTPTATPTGSPTTTPPGGPAVCSDNLDNDNDGRIDSADPACHTDRKAENASSYRPLFTSEADTQCSDGVDNDGDEKIDSADPGCHSDGNASNAASYDPADDKEENTQFDPGGIKAVD